MISNPFSRKPKSPVDQVLDAFDSVRSEAVDYAATIRDAAADVADTLTEIGPPAPKRKLPLIAAATAAGLGVAYVVRSRLRGPAPEVPGSPAAAPTATATAARTTPPAAAGTSPAVPGDAEEPREPKAETSEAAAAATTATANGSDAADAEGRDFKADETEVAKDEGEKG
jgi:hypothetical protein